MKIELGVIEQPYATGSLTTADVAAILERKYGIIGTFVDVHARDLQRILERSFVNAFEDMVNGLPGRDPYASAFQEIQMMMKRWLSTQEVERQGIKGVPTKAALDGRSSRFKSGLNRVSMKMFKKGVRKGVRRPSFIDSALMQASYKVWRG